MNIVISPFTIGSNDEFKLSLFKSDPDKYKQLEVYWGIYLNNEQISYTSNKGLAEQTKRWMENWLKARP